MSNGFHRSQWNASKEKFNKTMYIDEPGNPLKDRALSTLYTIEEKAEGVRPHFRALS